jgi:hypothetical protein
MQLLGALVWLGLVWFGLAWFGFFFFYPKITNENVKSQIRPFYLSATRSIVALAAVLEEGGESSSSTTILYLVPVGRVLVGNKWELLISWLAGARQPDIIVR